MPMFCMASARAGFVLRRRHGRERRIESGFVREWPLQSAVKNADGDIVFYLTQRARRTLEDGFDTRNKQEKELEGSE